MTEQAIRSGVWGKVPRWVLDLTMTRQQLRAFIALSCFANAARKAWPRQEVLARSLNLSRRRTRELLADLERLGLIRNLGRRRRTQSYCYLVAPFPEGVTDGGSEPAIESPVEGVFGPALETDQAGEFDGGPRSALMRADSEALDGGPEPARNRRNRPGEHYSEQGGLPAATGQGPSEPPPEDREKVLRELRGQRERVRSPHGRRILDREIAKLEEAKASEAEDEMIPAPEEASAP